MFTKHFGKVVLNILNLNPNVTLHHLIITLRPRPFVDNLCNKLITTLDELRTKVTKFMQMEELREFCNTAKEETSFPEKRPFDNERSS